MSRLMFKSILIRFLKLLEPENNSYKYVQYYREKMNKFIEEDEDNEIWKYKHAISACDAIDATILKQLLYMLMSIYEEKSKCRYHINDKTAATIEKGIIIDAINILKENKYISQKIVEINEIVTMEIDEEYFEIFKSKCGFDMIVNHAAITEITDENLLNVYQNFHNIKNLLEPIDLLSEKHKEIDDYLRCLSHFRINNE